MAPVYIQCVYGQCIGVCLCIYPYRGVGLLVIGDPEEAGELGIQAGCTSHHGTGTIRPGVGE